jgi:hypothetical protein
MKKILSRFAALGLVVGLAASSYAIPAAAAASDTQGGADSSLIVIIVGDDYVVVWVEGYTGGDGASAALTSAASDKLFDA